MNELLNTLFDYDAWATKQLLSVVIHLTPEQFTQEFGVERTSLQQQFVHVVAVADRARARLLREPVPNVDHQDFPLPQDLVDYESRVRKQLYELLANVPDNVLNEVRDFTTGSGTWRVAGADTLFQVINHSTYHRGQVALLLKLHNIPFPDTDYIVWRDEQRPC